MLGCSNGPHRFLLSATHRYLHPLTGAGSCSSLKTHHERTKVPPTGLSRQRWHLDAAYWAKKQESKMSNNCRWGYVLVASRKRAEINGAEDITAILDYAVRRSQGWPRSTTTAMFIGAQRLIYPIATALVDAHIAAGEPLAADHVNEICSDAIARTLRRRKKLESWTAKATQKKDKRFACASETALRLDLFHLQKAL